MVERVEHGATLRRSLTQATHAVLPARLFPWVPGAHATQSVDDVDFSVVEAVPLSHEVHVDWPAESAYEPAVQSEHEVAPFAPPVEVPMSQAVQASAFDAEKVLTGHSTHSTRSVTEKVPAAHSAQATDPSWVLAVP